MDRTQLLRPWPRPQGKVTSSSSNSLPGGLDCVSSRSLFPFQTIPFLGEKMKKVEEEFGQVWDRGQWCILKAIGCCVKSVKQVNVMPLRLPVSEWDASIYRIIPRLLSLTTGNAPGLLDTSEVRDYRVTRKSVLRVQSAASSLPLLLLILLR